MENQRASVAYRERAINLSAIRDRGAALAAPERSGDVTKATIYHAGSLSLTLIERRQLTVLSSFPSVLRGGRGGVFTGRQRRRHSGYVHSVWLDSRSGAIHMWCATAGRRAADLRARARARWNA